MLFVRNKIFRISLKLSLALLILCTCFFVYFVLAIRISTPPISDHSSEKLIRWNPFPEFYKIGPNWLKKSQSGLWEMYLEGPGYERGVVNGKLTRELAHEQERVFVKQIQKLIPSENYLNFLKYFVAYFNRHLPEHIIDEYKEEIYGVSLSASDEFDRLAPKYYRILNYHSAHDIGHALQDKNMTVGCTSFASWKQKSEDGGLVIGRNFDFFAGEDFARNKIVCFTKPEKGHKFMYVTWAGFTGVVSGMNDKGLTVTINAAKSEIPSSAATPISLLAKEILQFAGNIEQAYAIAKKRQTFVSESILLGSAADGKAVIIEKTPSKTNLYAEGAQQLVCSNHFKSGVFATDFINTKNIVESSSLYRDYRMKELLQKSGPMNPEKAAVVLRDQNGIGGKHIGLGNEKGLNQLIAHHSIIFQPSDLLAWVSVSPYQLGKYVCYDLKTIFVEAPYLNEKREIINEDRTIAEDPFLNSKEYKKFLLFKKLRSYIEHCTNSEFDLTVEPRFINTFEKTNANSYLTYWIIGNYYSKINNSEFAIRAYTKALNKEVPTKTELDKIRQRLRELKENDYK